MKKTTLLDLLMKYGTPTERQAINDVVRATPLITGLPSAVIPGTQYQYRQLVDLPLVGARPVNAGIETHKTNYVIKNDQCFLYNGLICVDKALAAADPEGEATVLAEETETHMQGLLFSLEQGLIYGKALGEHGMPGLMDGIGDYMTISADDAVNANPSTYVPGGASVWAVVDDPKMLRIIYGNKKAIAFGPIKEGPIAQKTADGKDGVMTALSRDVIVWVGVSVRSQFAVARLVNESPNKPLTDAKLAKLLACFPAGVRPTRFIMRTDTRSRLQENRHAVSTYTKKQSGQTPYPSLPTEYEGIPIEVTDALIADETPENIAALAKVNRLTAQKFGTIKR